MMFNDGCKISRERIFRALLFVFAMVLIYTNDKYLLRLLSSDFIFGEIMRLAISRLSRSQTRTRRGANLIMLMTVSLAFCNSLFQQNVFPLKSRDN